ncbi:hypothetical protein CCYN49044_180005 [Capnocytophaga cynodegmi]|nr:hypothetical protein CCYN49044_180005 [Capnocytophaga cynodegmi]
MAKQENIIRSSLMTTLNAFGNIFYYLENIFIGISMFIYSFACDSFYLQNIIYIGQIYNITNHIPPIVNFFLVVSMKIKRDIMFFRIHFDVSRKILPIIDF